LLCIDTTTNDMIIKIDCREKDLLELMKPATPVATVAPVAPEPDHYIMDLGDGITMKVPLPKKNTPMTKTKNHPPRASLAATAAAATATTHEIKTERLPLGDIILHDAGSGRDIVIFERKTLNDLAASIQDGRYKEQSFRLIETAAATGFHTHNIVYIIEGDLAQYEAKRNKNNRITKTALQSAMVSLMYYKGFSVFRTMNLGETADFILHFADKVAKESGDGMRPAYNVDGGGGGGDDTTSAATQTLAQAYSEVSAKKEKRDYITRENIGEIMLAQVPGVSPKIAAAILAKYGGSLYEFLGDLHRKINDYEESLSPEMSPPSPEAGGVMPTGTTIEPMNKNKYKHVSACFKDVTVDGKRGIGKVTVEKVCFFLG
jgi:ERCC4-type nuclease